MATDGNISGKAEDAAIESGILKCGLGKAEVKPLPVRDWLKGIQDKKDHRPLASKTRGHIKGLMHRTFDCAILGVPAHGPHSSVSGANGGLLEAEKEIANSHSQAVLAPHRCGQPGTLSHHGNSGPLHRREVFGAGRPKVERF